MLWHNLNRSQRQPRRRCWRLSVVNDVDTTGTEHANERGLCCNQRETNSHPQHLPTSPNYTNFSRLKKDEIKNNLLTNSLDSSYLFLFFCHSFPSIALFFALSLSLLSRNIKCNDVSKFGIYLLVKKDDKNMIVEIIVCSFSITLRHFSV